MSELTVESLRGNVPESRHRVSVAVVNAAGHLERYSGDPRFMTFMRSAAKPFQALPVIESGAAESFGFSDAEVALACASHSSEPQQVQAVSALLARIGCVEADLACGAHRPLSADLALPAPARDASSGPAVPRTPLASNCSGKHTAMLALARHCGWPTSGYERADHPVQGRCRESVLRWTGVREDHLAEGVDGCGVVAFAVPLQAMAFAYARLGVSAEPAARRVVAAMTGHPHLVAGARRPCSALMSAYQGRVLAKVGAEGVYGAALPDRGLGIAVKVESGHTWAAVVALIAVLDALELEPRPSAALLTYAAPGVFNTRGLQVGSLRASGGLAGA
ncbi:MAG TPA: asparaginase [Gemmatimonadales bacterium]|nr:asparaginase [Gemmatimonadales bacterium]